MDRQRDGFIVWEEALGRGSPARELEPPATYRLGVDKRREKSQEGH
jgi:hypothetical protein